MIHALIGRRRDARRGTWNLERLEDRTVPAIAFATGSGPGTNGVVNVYNEDSLIIKTFNPYPGFTGGVRVAVADVTGDGEADIVTAPGPGGLPVIRIFDGTALIQGVERSIRDFFAYSQAFTGGVFVAAGDVDGDGFADVTTGPDVGGGPHVVCFSGATGATLLTFFAYDPSFTGGVRVACSDVGGDNGGTAGGTGDQEIICGAGPGGGPHVTVWEYDNEVYSPDRFISFFAYETGFTGGVYVGGGRITNNMDEQGFAYSDIVTGPGEGGGPLLRIWSVDDASNRDNYIVIKTREQIIFGSDQRAGLRVGGVLDLNGDGRDDFLATTGVGVAPAGLALFTTDTPEPPPDTELNQIGVVATFETFDATFLGGVYVNG